MYRKFKKGDYVQITDDETYEYGHRIPIGTITKIIQVSTHPSSVFPYITQHSKREIRDSEILKIYRIGNGENMWTEKDFIIKSFPTIEYFREEFKSQLTPTTITEFMLIDRFGTCYSCDFGGHTSLSSVICDYLSDKLTQKFNLSNKTSLDFLIENEQWISIAHKGYEREPSITCFKKVTKQQDIIIYDYIEKFNLKKYPKIITICDTNVVV